jgi:hypothetical protein
MTTTTTTWQTTMIPPVVAFHDVCHDVANELLATATTQLEAHLEVEQSYPYT